MTNDQRDRLARVLEPMVRSIANGAYSAGGSSDYEIKEDAEELATAAAEFIAGEMEKRKNTSKASYLKTLQSTCNFIWGTSAHSLTWLRPSPLRQARRAAMQSINGRLTPVEGQIWKHTKTGNTYQIVGAVFNTVTDRMDVIYRDFIQQSEHNWFSRQLSGCEKAFLSLNDDGSRRFIAIALSGEDYFERYLKESTEADAERIRREEDV